MKEQLAKIREGLEKVAIHSDATASPLAAYPLNEAFKALIELERLAEPQGAPYFQGETCSRSMPKASAEYGHLYTRGWCEWCNGEPHGAPPEGEWHTCCGNKLSFGQRCPDCRTIRYREC